MYIFSPLILCFCFLSAFFFAPASGFGKEKLVVISPHRKSIQKEVIPLFEKRYKELYGTEISVDWIDQGGTENDLRYVNAKFKANPQTAEIDIFWGGGDLTFHDLDHEHLLLRHPLPATLVREIPESVVGIPLRSPTGTWYSAAISSFGIFYNKKMIKQLKLKEPQSWEDLADPQYFGQISNADPRHSASVLVSDIVILNSLGWEKGWQVLAASAGNTRKFTQSSSDPIKAVVSGEALVAPVIDFYAFAKVAELGEDNVGFVLPTGKTIFNSDPIAILKGAPNLKAAERFIDFVLSAEAQKVLILPVGPKDGPRYAALGRIAVNQAAYQETEGRRISPFNPFTAPAPTFQLDMNKLTETKQLIGDLIGAIHIDTHGDLKTAWQTVFKGGVNEKLWKEIATPPLSEDEVTKLSGKWEDSVLRNKMLNQWSSEAKKKYLAATALKPAS